MAEAEALPPFINREAHSPSELRVISAVYRMLLPDERRVLLELDAEIQARIAALEAEVARKENVSFFAFVAGAKWWEYSRPGGGATMWPADIRRAEEAAKERFPYAPDPLVVEANAQRDAALRDVAKLEVLILALDRGETFAQPILASEAERIRSRTR